MNSRKDGKLEYLRPGGVVPIGLYSVASCVKAGSDLLYIAGQLSVDSDGNSVGEGDFAAQFRQVFNNLKTTLEGCGSSLDRVSKFTSYVREPEHIKAYYEVRAEVFPELFETEEYPPNTLLVVSRMVRAEFLLEVEAVAVKT